MSYAQRRLWFFDQSSKQSTAYHIRRIFHLRGALDERALALALIDVVRRHDALRTVFRSTAEDTHQVELEVGEVGDILTILNASASEVDSLIADEAGRPFELARDLPIRAVLFRLRDEEYQLLLVLHHIATDAWSFDLLMRDFASAYSARRSGNAPDFDEVGMRYADYTLWQQSSLGDPNDLGSLAARQLAYWRDLLAGLPDQLHIPYDKSRSTVAANRGDVVEFSVDKHTHIRMNALARAARASPLMVGQALVATWLSRLGAGMDIPVGTVYSARDEARLEELVGQVVNTVVIRHDLAGDPSFEELVERTRDAVLTAFEHAEVPFDLVVDSVNPPRSPGRNPIFQVMSTWQRHAGETGGLVLDSVAVSGDSVPSEHSKFDLSVDFFEHFVDGSASGLDCKIEYDAGLFDRVTMQSMARMLAALINAVAQNSEQALSEIEYVGTDECQRLLETWNDTAVEQSDTSLPQMFEAQARRFPADVAVEAADLSLTYAELNARANRLAHMLMEQGAGPEVYVAVVTPRTTALIAMLAVLKAGATFLPVDPEYPADRIAFILGDAKPSLILTVDGTLADDWPGRTLVLDHADTVRALDRCSESDPDHSRFHPDSPAYIVYTSGSTGRPKGVVVTARVLINLLSWQVGVLDSGSRGLRVSQFSAIGFDAFEQEILAAWFTGQTVVVPPEDTRRDLYALARWLDDRRINEFLAPDIVLRTTLAAALDQGLRLEQLRTVIQGGEPFQLTDVVKEFYRRHPAVKVVNHYGPSETHVITGWDVPDDPLLWPSVAPIGKPIWNCQTYVLDDRLRPVSVGVAGELYLAGAGLARGYLQRPGLTAERFVANPFGRSGERMYRTGDVVRWNGKGELIFVGRADDQVKIHGVRVEPNEINSILREHLSVRQAVTIVREEDSGGRRLISYIVPSSDERPRAATLRQHVAAFLPAAVVPSAFVVIDALPLNSNGKLDRQALPSPDYSVESAGASRAPRSPMESALCTAFSEILEVADVGIDDSFFDLGGHSLLAVRLINAIRSTVGAEVSVRTLFENPTVAGLAGLAAPSGRQVRPPLRPIVRSELMPLSFAQLRLWSIDQVEGPTSRYNLPLLTHRIRGHLDLDALEMALTDVVARHESLRTIFPDVNGRPFQRILAPEEVSSCLVRSNVGIEDLDRRVRQVREAHFELSTEIPVRAEVLSLSADEHVFVLVTHHIVSDGWSVAPLCRDLNRAYSARQTGAVPKFTPLPVQYVDFAHWQKELLGDQNDPTSLMAVQSEVWRSALADSPQELALPWDRSRPPISSDRGGTVHFEIGADVFARVQKLAQIEGVTPFMVLHAALTVLLSRSGAGYDIPIGTTVAGRSDPLLDDLVGCFINLLVLRVDATGNPTFRELLARVRDTALLALQSQELPFERLVAALNPPRSQARHPLFQVLLTMEVGGSALDLAGVSVSEYSAANGSTSKFDLTIGFRQPSTTGSVLGAIEYSVDLFDIETITAIARKLDEILRSTTLNPDEALENVCGAYSPDFLEESLCAMFAEALGVDTVMIDDDFFDLGGHSLLAIELVSKIRAKYHVKLKVRTFFFNPTVAEIREIVGRQL